MGCNRCGYEGRVALSTCSGYRLVRTPVTYNDPEQSTRVTLNRYVRVTNPVLDILGCVTKRIYRNSHDTVMKEGESGLRDYCERKSRDQEA
jgi:hypothetical protein